MRLPVASYNQPSRNSGRLINCFALPSKGKTPMDIQGLPGIATQAALQGGGRGLHVARNTLMAVAGSTLYDALTGSELGSLPGSEMLTFATNPTQTVFSNGYVYDTTVRRITDADKVPWAAVDYCDGYVVAVEKNTGRFIGSALNDGTDYNGLDFATAEGAPDDLVTLKVDHRQVILFGKDSTEIWWNSGASGFPFERMASGFVEQGCLGGVVKADHSVFWIANDRTIRRLSGSTAVRVSQTGVEEALLGYTVSDAIAFSFAWNGQVFVWFRFPTDNASWVLNVTTNEWFESDVPLVSAATFNGEVYVQHEDGRVGRLTTDPYQFGEIPRYVVRFPNVYSQNRPQFFSQFDAVLVTGNAPAGVTPFATLRVSHDGGNIWHTLPLRAIGQTGDYARPVRWTQLGRGRDTVFELEVSAPVTFCLTDAQVR